MGRTIATAVAIGLLLITAVPAQAAADHVRYEVTSNATLSLVTYMNYAGDITQGRPPGTETGFIDEFDNEATHPFYSVSAQTNGDDVACNIYVNGTLIDSNESTGQYTIASCQSH